MRYGYATQNGIPKLKRIVDPVDTPRFALLRYQGEQGCGNTSTGFTPVSANMLCAFTTYDGRRTDSFYKDGRLARVTLPGKVVYDLGYDGNGVLVSVRDVAPTMRWRPEFGRRTPAC